VDLVLPKERDYIFHVYLLDNWVFRGRKWNTASEITGPWAILKMNTILKNCSVHFIIFQNVVTMAYSLRLIYFYCLLKKDLTLSKNRQIVMQLARNTVEVKEETYCIYPNIK
jgi:hypothetical protein